jgi:hypothetical protein
LSIWLSLAVVAVAHVVVVLVVLAVIALLLLVLQMVAVGVLNPFQQLVLVLEHIR